MDLYNKRFVRMLIILFLTLGFLQLPVLAAELPESEELLQSEAESKTENQAESQELSQTEIRSEVQEQWEALEEETPQEGWYQEEGKTYYYVAGEMQTGLQEIEGKKYYFALESGELQNGLQEIEGKKYY